MLPYIDGQLVATAASESVINPATDESVAEVGLVDIDLTQQALEAAEKAFPSWSQTPADKRAEWMLKLRDAVVQNEDYLRNLVHLEMAKPWAATGEDYQLLIDSLEYYADEAKKIETEELVDREGTHSHIITREPVGVVGAFLAWNFPLLNLAYKLGPAMAAGCPIVIKPSRQTPISAYAVGALCADIGLPAGVVNIICGQDSEVGDLYLRFAHPADADTYRLHADRNACDACRFHDDKALFYGIGGRCAGFGL